MSCEALKAGLIYDYLEGLLSEEEAQAVLAHTEGCDSCKAHLLDARFMLSALSEETEEAPPAELREGILSALSAEKRRKKAGRRSVIKFSAAAALFAVVILAGGNRVLYSGGETDGALPAPFAASEAEAGGLERADTFALGDAPYEENQNAADAAGSTLTDSTVTTPALGGEKQDGLPEERTQENGTEGTAEGAGGEGTMPMKITGFSMLPKDSVASVAVSLTPEQAAEIKARFFSEEDGESPFLLTPELFGEVRSYLDALEIPYTLMDEGGEAYLIFE